MLLRFASLLAFALLLSPGVTARASDLGAEYAQVRKIALRDQRVHDAFARANERLDEKIVALDPALAAWVHAHPSGGGEVATAEVPRQPFRTAAAKPAAASSGKTHTVAEGETLSSIAKQYEVSVQKLQAANHIEDARKLRVGQTLSIP